MDAARYERVSEIFQHALGLSHEERAAYLDQACAGDDQLRREALELLEQDQSAGGFLEPTVGAVADGRPATGRYTRVGRYEVVEELGRGGMGVVLRAVQQRPQRDVAIKLIQPELAGRAAAERLRHEAELLGRLRHPGIARIYEAGEGRVLDDAGGERELPFIAMELVEGVPLTEYAQSHGLGIRERVALLAGLCDALQHAHQRGVVHLDLKPANILVEDDGVARVLDFGVARALDRGVEQRLAEGGSVVGTLAYMPPEQLTGHTQDLDTRADIYALGAVGFELLTGRPPREVRGQDPADALLAALTSPLRPPSTFNRAIDAELDAVLLKAMAPDREQRYASCGQFAGDLRRVLRSEPVDALSGSALRRLRLLARRRRPAFIAGGVTAAACVVAVVLLALSLLRAHELAGRERAARLAAGEATIKAQAQAERSARMASFLQNAILGVDPEELGQGATYFDALDYAAGRISRDLADAPLVEAEVRYAIGFVYRRHAMFGPARRHIAAAMRLFEAHLGPADPKTIAATEEVAYLTLIVDGQAEQAERLFRDILRVQHEEGRADTPEAGWQRLKLGMALLAQDRLREARDELAIAEGLLATHYGEPFRARALAVTALVELHSGDAPTARATLKRALKLVEGEEDQAYMRARLQVAMARVLLALSDTTGSNAILMEGAGGLTAVLPDDHVEIADALELAAEIDLAAGRLRGAAAHAGACDAIRASRLGPDHPSMLRARAVTILATTAQADPRQAMHELDALVERAEQLVGTDHRLSLWLRTAAHDCATRAGEDLAARDRARVLAELTERRKRRLGIGG